MERIEKKTPTKKQKRVKMSLVLGNSHCSCFLFLFIHSPLGLPLILYPPRQSGVFLPSTNKYDISLPMGSCHFLVLSTLLSPPPLFPTVEPNNQKKTCFTPLFPLALIGQKPERSTLIFLRRSTFRSAFCCSRLRKGILPLSGSCDAIAFLHAAPPREKGHLAQFSWVFFLGLIFSDCVRSFAHLKTEPRVCFRHLYCP